MFVFITAVIKTSRSCDLILFYGEIDEETEIDELLLTNKNLICVIDKSIGLFKSEKVAKKIPLTDIKVVDGQAQIMEVSLDFGDTAFQILYTNGKRHISQIGKKRNSGVDKQNKSSCNRQNRTAC